MQNPFATLEDWLRRIEANQNELLQRLNAPAAAGPEVGGIELACEVLRLSKPRIYTLVSERAIPHMKRGGRLTFSRAELLSYLQAGSRKGATTNGLTNGR
ncbi:helix-turn-helix domain-containing protein [Hymenobacter psychrophilus]|uniref:DNA binding domain-containing protein, excisionase family n=1 Tax=Hymenobacter psychrophilus TaxID=651662 RepID=A0A1H3EPQ2_9BACT|nr:helix-turn-helix domain-containing protein [Hymenobacter psychrophilus]SDX80732.1 DNA binding domain-containing protein, excisionase family [Hymenobacter psychrophilus]